MRLAWYAGVSTALAATVTVSAFYQRANFYSAMVHLAQSNLCVLVLINFIFLIYGTFMYGLQRLLFGRLRPTEIEQLSDNAWFAITETCLAMTTFRDEMGAWFLVMFTALVTGKVWGWIGDGRIEILEQQPPANPRLFHARLASSLLISLLYDVLILRYSIQVVIQQARPNMMVMFLFEFAILAACSARTLCRYGLCLVETAVVQRQTKQRLEERRRQTREQREAALAERQANPESTETRAPLPDENDIDEMDIEVPGWEAKGQWVLVLELVTDFAKLCIYGAFFFILLAFYGLPIHIMRDLFMTARSFFKSLAALLRYRRALQDLRRYPDAMPDDLVRDPTCIICREEMRPFDPQAAGAMERYRPKKLRCGHILHLGCLKSWLERQQVCPTCRTPVSLGNQANNARGGGDRVIAGARLNFGFPPAQAAAQQQQGNGGNAGGQNDQQQQQQPVDGVRVIRLGPVRVEFARGDAAANLAAAAAGGNVAAPQPERQERPERSSRTTIRARSVRSAITELDALIQREIQELQGQQLELQTLYLLNAELRRIRQMNQQQQQQLAQAQAQAQAGHHGSSASPQPTAIPTQPAHANGVVPALNANAVAAAAAPMPQFPANATTAPQFPTFPTAFPSRLNTPSLPRHDRVSRYSPSTTAAIPAGSPDLPDGVVLPPGWSLLPLSRLDGQVQSIPHIPGFSPPMGEGSSTPARQSTPNPDAAAAYGFAGAPPPPLPPAPAPAPASLLDGRQDQPGEPSRQVNGTTSVEAPQVVAPNPVAPPNWGGSAQLFGGGSGSGIESLESRVQPTPTPTVPEETPESVDMEPSASVHDGQADDEQRQDGGQPDKGKGKAVTVEETEDDG